MLSHFMGEWIVHFKSPHWAVLLLFQLIQDVQKFLDYFTLSTRQTRLRHCFKLWAIKITENVDVLDGMKSSAQETYPEIENDLQRTRDRL